MTGIKLSELLLKVGHADHLIVWLVAAHSRYKLFQVSHLLCERYPSRVLLTFRTAYVYDSPIYESFVFWIARLIGADIGLFTLNDLIRFCLGRRLYDSQAWRLWSSLAIINVVSVWTRQTLAHEFCVAQICNSLRLAHYFSKDYSFRNLRVVRATWWQFFRPALYMVEKSFSLRPWTEFRLMYIPGLRLKVSARTHGWPRLFRLFFFLFLPFHYLGRLRQAESIAFVTL